MEVREQERERVRVGEGRGGEGEREQGEREEGEGERLINSCNYFCETRSRMVPFPIPLLINLIH